MAWTVASPAGTDAANTIDTSVQANNTALDTWASAFTDGISAAGAVILKMYRAANATVEKFRSDAADTVDRWARDLNGKLSWGSGSAAADVTLERGGANYLSLGSDDTLRGATNPTNVSDLVRNGFLVRGRIDTTTPTILQGVGFTVVKNGTGDVTITFSTAFGGIPAVVATVDRAVGSNAESIFLQGAPTTTTARVQRITATALEDGTFSFLAIGN